MENDIYKTRVTRFFQDEDGAITVDWIVLTATLIALGMAAAFYVGANVPGVADKASNYMTNYSYSN